MSRGVTERKADARGKVSSEQGGGKVSSEQGEEKRAQSRGCVRGDPGSEIGCRAERSLCKAEKEGSFRGETKRHISVVDQFLAECLNFLDKEFRVLIPSAPSVCTTILSQKDKCVVWCGVRSWR